MYLHILILGVGECGLGNHLDFNGQTQKGVSKTTTNYFITKEFK